MKPMLEYEFKSASGRSVTIKSRMGEESARSAAMEFLWGPPRDWCENRGEGLDLVQVKGDLTAE